MQELYSLPTVNDCRKGHNTAYSTVYTSTYKTTNKKIWLYNKTI